MSEAMHECLNGADDVIQQLSKHGHGDYSKHREQIAMKLYFNGIYDGNWNCSVSFDDGMKGLRLIQEDEYDQHMDDDSEKPSYDSMVAQVDGGYLWVES